LKKQVKELKDKVEKLLARIKQQETEIIKIWTEN